MNSPELGPSSGDGALRVAVDESMHCSRTDESCYVLAAAVIAEEQWGDVGSSLLVYTRDGRVHRFGSPESARAILGRRLRRQLSLVYA